MSIDAALLEILACPVCRGDLEPLAGEKPGQDCLGLYCRACALVYPVRDSIPVLLKEEALPKADWDAGKR